VLVPVFPAPLVGGFDLSDTTVSVGFFLSVIVTSALRWLSGSYIFSPLNV
jgi:hypothetical protein